MANSKIQLADGTVLLDLTGDTVTAENLLEGIIAHGADGEEIIGQLAAGGGLPEGIAAMTSGVYILSSAAATAEIEHGLGMTPDFFFMSGNTSDALYHAVNDYFSLSDCILYKAIRRNEEIFGGLAPSETIFTDSTVSLSVSTAKFNAGVNYTWYAGVFA